MRISSVAALAALTILGTGAFVIAATGTAKATETCVSQSVLVSQYVVVDDDSMRGQSVIIEYCNRYAVPLDQVTSVVADSARITRDFMTLLATVVEASKERFAVMSENVHLQANAMHFRRDANCPVDKKPSGSCFPLGSQTFELRTPASAAFALAPR